MMDKKEMQTARAALIDCHRFSGNITPAGTVASLVQVLGYESAREIVALTVISKGEWDKRISETARVWAFDLTGTTYGSLSALGYYYPDEIHPAHMEQIARAMMAYQPEPQQTETEQPTAAQYTETRIMYADQLRALCIRHSWYTRGTCSEYERLFDRLQDERGNLRNLTTADLAGIAQDIADHSIMFDGWDIPDIMYELACACTVTFGTVEAVPAESPRQCEDESDEPTRKTRAERAAYALKMAHEYTDHARDDLKWTRADRIAGDRLESCWGLKKAAHHRKNAAEWFRRYRRAAGRRFRDIETGQTLTESELLEIYQNDKGLRDEYPSAGAYVNACQTYQGGTLVEIR